MKIQLWDDGDYDVWAYHKMGSDEREQVVYDDETGVVSWQYLKGQSWEAEYVSEEGDTRYAPSFEEYEERRITTLAPPELD